MANGTYYVDNVNGNDANTGLSEAQAKATLSAGVGLWSGGGNKLYVQAAGSNYSLTSSVTPASGDSTNGPNVIEGYTTTPGARDGRPTITSSTSGLALFSANPSYVRFRHLKFTHTGATRGLLMAYAGAFPGPFYIDDCDIDGLLGIWNASRTDIHIRLTRSRVRNCTGNILTDRNGNLEVVGNLFKGNTGSYVIQNLGEGWPLLVAHNMFDANSGSPIYLWHNSASTRIRIYNNGFRNNGASGFILEKTSSSATLEMIHYNNIYYNQTGYGIDPGASALSATLGALAMSMNNAFGDNSSGAYRNWITEEDEITLADGDDPWVDPANEDYSLKDTGNGALLRAAGFPSGFLGGGSSFYPDVGPGQHQDAGGGGSTVIVIDD
jgi:hypothetical protein